MNDDLFLSFKQDTKKFSMEFDLSTEMSFNLKYEHANNRDRECEIERNLRLHCE